MIAKLRNGVVPAISFIFYVVLKSLEFGGTDLTPGSADDALSR